MPLTPTFPNWVWTVVWVFTKRQVPRAATLHTQAHVMDKDVMTVMHMARPELWFVMAETRLQDKKEEDTLSTHVEAFVEKVTKSHDTH